MDEHPPTGSCSIALEISAAGTAERDSGFPDAAMLRTSALQELMLVAAEDTARRLLPMMGDETRPNDRETPEGGYPAGSRRDALCRRQTGRGSVAGDPR